MQLTTLLSRVRLAAGDFAAAPVAGGAGLPAHESVDPLDPDLLDPHPLDSDALAPDHTDDVAVDRRVTVDP